jgi:GntR family carbon starvation induced transcriptional regulator
MDTPAKRVQGTAAPDDSKPRTLVKDIYQRLRSEIIRGHLVPGIRLRAEHLKGEYNVSGATMREALALLVADALVVSREQRGFIVAPVSIADFVDITDTRALMESHAVRMSIRDGDDEWEANLSGAFRRLSLAEERREPGGDDNYWEECNRKFHEALIAGHESLWLHHFLKILYHQSERYRRIARFNAPPERDVHKEHVSIFEAAIARDEDAASGLIERHIRVTLDVIQTLDTTFTESNAA